LRPELDGLSAEDAEDAEVALPPSFGDSFIRGRSQRSQAYTAPVHPCTITANNLYQASPGKLKEISTADSSVHAIQVKASPVNGVTNPFFSAFCVLCGKFRRHVEPKFVFDQSPDQPKPTQQEIWRLSRL
jgi:hypothetical protein